jgi:hypothetical protein
MAATIANENLQITVKMAAIQYTGANKTECTNWLEAQQAPQIVWEVCEQTFGHIAGAHIVVANIVEGEVQAITPGHYIVVFSHPTWLTPVITFLPGNVFKANYL